MFMKKYRSNQAVHVDCNSIQITNAADDVWLNRLLANQAPAVLADQLLGTWRQWLRPFGVPFGFAGAMY